MKPTRDGWVFESTGREMLYAMSDVFGINSSGEVGSGWDTMLDADEAGWTTAERTELADMMIEHWTAFKQGGGEVLVPAQDGGGQC